MIHKNETHKNETHKNDSQKKFTTMIHKNYPQK